jgi:serine/threonine-protein kinase RsbW
MSETTQAGTPSAWASLREEQREERPVTLVIPPTSEHVRFVRLVMSGMAARAGFDYDTIEDLRIAVDELSTFLVSHATGDVTVEFFSLLDGVEVSGTAPAQPSRRERAPEELSAQILRAVVDHYGVADNGTSVTFTMSKRTAAPPQ